MDDMNRKDRMRPKMPPSQRAKQFMPFAAVTGLEAALRKKERELGLTGRRELSAEEADAVNRMIPLLERGMPVRIVFYREDQEAAPGAGEYVAAEGVIDSVDLAMRRIKLQAGDAGAREEEEEYGKKRSPAISKHEMIEIEIRNISEIEAENTRA